MENGTLSTREREVLERVASGLSNRELGDELFVSENTVKKHLANIYSKLEVSSAAPFCQASSTSSRRPLWER